MESLAKSLDDPERLDLRDRFPEPFPCRGLSEPALLGFGADFGNISVAGGSKLGVESERLAVPQFEQNR